MSRRSSTLLIAAMALTTLPACGLTNALNGNRDQGSGEGDGGTDPLKDTDTPDPDAGDTGEPPSCEEGKADRCTDTANEMCLQGSCSQRCTFGPANANNEPRVTPNPGMMFPTCPDDEVCIPTSFQDTNYFGACVSAQRAQELRANNSCDDIDIPNESSYCKQLLQDGDAVCDDDRCIIECSEDEDCPRDEFCAFDEDEQDSTGACVPSFCEDTPDPALTCAQFFNQAGAPHPGGDDDDPFTRDDAYCLNNNCYIRFGDEAEQGCAGADSNACKDDQVCVDETYCMDVCEGDDCGDLACAYTLPIDEPIDTDDDVSAYVCVDDSTINVGQLADPIAFCDEVVRDGETGPASWDRETGECVFGARPLDPNEVRYVYIQDASFDCNMNGNAAGDIPGFADPGPDISFVGLSNNSEPDPLNATVFNDVYAVGRVVKVFRTGGTDNQLPGYGHLDGQLLDGESRYSTTDGCPTMAPAPNNTVSLGCGGGVFVEFSPTDDPSQVVTLSNEGSNKYVVVSEHSSLCGDFQSEADIFEQYKVSYCAVGVGLDALTPADCQTDLFNVTVSMPEAEGPAVFSFGLP